MSLEKKILIGKNMKNKLFFAAKTLIIPGILMLLFIYLRCKNEEKVPNTTEIVLPTGYENSYYEGMRYGLFVPPSYDSTRSYPLIISLHGSTDTTSWDLGWYHDPVQTTDPCFVLTPKSLVASNGWGNSWTAGFSADMKKTLEIADSLIEKFNIDTNRLYIYGTSMGGYGVFSVLANQPGRFAGAFSICGGGNPATAKSVMETPLWIFHGSDDNVVPVSYSRDMYQAILNAGGKQVRYTEYPGVKHDAWTPAWKEPTLEWWLLAQKKGVQHGRPDTAENFKYEIMKNKQVELSWNPPADKTKPDNQIWYYKLFRNNELIAEINSTDSSYVDSNLISGTTYQYSMAAVNYFFELSKGASIISVMIP
jgi:hypothetical protein